MSQGVRPDYFDTSYSAAELMRLTDEDLEQLEALAGEPEGYALWWMLTRQIWAEEDAD